MKPPLEVFQSAVEIMDDVRLGSAVTFLETQFLSGENEPGFDEARFLFNRFRDALGSEVERRSGRPTVNL